MRTKTLLVAAAISAVGLTASLAQSVYSVNVVGYVNATIVPGFNMVANPLDAQGGNGIANVMPQVPDGTLAYTYNAGVGFRPIASFLAGAWYEFSDEIGDYVPSTAIMGPGDGFFLYNAGSTNFTVTFVGDVRQGDLSVPLQLGFNMISMLSPQNADLSQSQWAFPASDGDLLYFYSNGVGYLPIKTFLLGGWYEFSEEVGDYVPTTPAVTVGQGFFCYKPSVTATWGYNFQVNN